MAQSQFNGVGTHGDARAVWNANAVDAEARLTAITGSTLGFEDANNSGSPIAISADTWSIIPNDAAGPFSNTTYLPSGVTSMFDGGTGQIDPTQLALGDAALVRNDFSLTPSINGAHIQFRYTLGAGGGSYTLEHQLGTMSNGGGVPYRFQFTDLIYMGDTNTRDNHIGLEVKCSEAATLANSGSVVQLVRRAV